MGFDEVEKLYEACKPAPFGRGGETVVDESYRKAGKLELDAFSTPFDPHNFGMHDLIAKRLLTDKYPGSVEMELYKLNVYGKGDFFKPHKDTPRSQDMFGSLVVVLPSPHEGGSLVLRHGEKRWTMDFSDNLAAATEPSVCFAAFFSDIEHEVLPVTSGHRVTLTYNLYRKPPHPGVASLPTPSLQTLRRALVDVVNDKSKLVNGGYLGFGLAHEYVFSGKQPVTILASQLKGSDRALADVCDELGLKYSLRLLYRIEDDESEVCLLTTRKISCEDCTDLRDSDDGPDYFDWFIGAVRQLGSEDAEGVVFVDDSEIDIDELVDKHSFMKKFYRDPVAEVLEITPMQSSVWVGTAYACLGNSASVEYYYGTACMVVAVDPVKSRSPLEV